MKKLAAFLTIVALLATSLLVLTACGKQAPTAPSESQDQLISGGFSKANSPVITLEIKALFDRLDIVGATYVPVANIGSQVVAGTNHCVLCKVTPVVPNAKASYVIVYLYEDFNGDVKVTETLDCGVTAENGEGTGAWQETSSPVLTEEAKHALEKATEQLVGMEYAPIALLATQVVSGMNYCLLCKTQAVTPEAEPTFALVYVYASLDGNAEITDTKVFTEDPREENVQIPNPLTEYDTLEGAQEAVGFPLELPNDAKATGYIVIGGNLLEIRLADGYIRKAVGSDDISGDCNDYSSITQKAVEGKEITLKGNDGKVVLAIWNDDRYTYCVNLTDGVDEAAMLSFVNAVK